MVAPWQPSFCYEMIRIDLFVCTIVQSKWYTQSCQYIFYFDFGYNQTLFVDFSPKKLFSIFISMTFVICNDKLFIYKRARERESDPEIYLMK